MAQQERRLDRKELEDIVNGIIGSRETVSADEITTQLEETIHDLGIQVVRPPRGEILEASLQNFRDRNSNKSS